MEPTQPIAKTITCDNVEIPYDRDDSSEWVSVADRLKYWRHEARRLQERVTELKQENDDLRDSLNLLDDAEPDAEWLYCDELDDPSLFVEHYI